MDDNMSRIVNGAHELFLPVLESTVVMAAQYATKCNRNGVTTMDMQYAWRYCARNILGRHSGSLCPEIHEDGDSGDEGEEEYIVDDSDIDEFTRYEGDDPIIVKVNECYDTWDEWEPENQASRMLKDALNSIDIEELIKNTNDSNDIDE